MALRGLVTTRAVAFFFIFSCDYRQIFTKAIIFIKKGHNRICILFYAFKLTRRIKNINTVNAKRNKTSQFS